MPRGPARSFGVPFPCHSRERGTAFLSSLNVTLFSRGVRLIGAWVRVCSRNGTVGHALLLGGPSVSLAFRQRLVAQGRHDLVRSYRGVMVQST